MSSMVDYYPLPSENQRPTHHQSFRDFPSQNLSRQPGGEGGGQHQPSDGLGKGSYHNSSSRYNSTRSPPRRYQSHIGISNTNGSTHNKSFRKSPNRSTSSVSCTSNNNNNIIINNKNNDPLLSNSNHSTRSNNNGITGGSFQHSYKKPMMPGKQLYLAMDCEMVGTISGQSVAARVVLVDWKGRKVYDSYLKPKETVTDYRTFVSGVTEEHLTNAPSSEEVLQIVQDLLQDKIIVGHGLDNDLKALGLTHPWNMTRDTAYYQPFMRLLEGSAQPVWGPRKLKELAKEKLQRDIQTMGVSHCPVEDAVAALDLYKSHRPRWEACMSNEEKRARQQALQQAAAAAAANRYTHDFDELSSYTTTALQMHPPSTSYSYHGTSTSCAPTVPSNGIPNSMSYHHRHIHHHHQSPFRPPSSYLSKRDPLQSQSFHYPRSHTMMEYRDYNACNMTDPTPSSSLLDQPHSFHFLRSASMSYDSTSIETVDEFGGDEEDYDQQQYQQQHQHNSIYSQYETPPPASLYRQCVSN